MPEVPATFTLDETLTEIDSWDLSYLSPKQFDDYPDNISRFYTLCESRNVTNFVKPEDNIMYQECKILRRRDSIIEDLID